METIDIKVKVPWWRHFVLPFVKTEYVTTIDEGQLYEFKFKRFKGVIYVVGFEQTEALSFGKMHQVMQKLFKLARGKID